MGVALDGDMERDRALWILGHADQEEPREPLRGMALQLRLWRYRRAGLHVSWSIILPVRDYRDRSAVVREASWDRGASVRIRDVDLAWSDLAPFLDSAGGLRPGGAAVPDTAAVSSGLEGTRSFAHIRLEWAGQGPRWFGQFRNLLVRALKKTP